MVPIEETSGRTAALPSLEERLREAARHAVDLGFLLRDFHAAFPEVPPGDLLDFTGSVILDGFEAPPGVESIAVEVGVMGAPPKAPAMRRPATVQ